MRFERKFFIKIVFCGLLLLGQKSFAEDSAVLDEIVLNTTPEQTVEQPQEKSKVKNWLEGDYATGSWFGWRPKLEKHGITVNRSYMLNNFVKEHGGGIYEGSKPSFQGVLSTSVEIDTEKAGLYKGGKAYVLFQNVLGKGLSEKHVGDYMFFNGYESLRSGSQFSEYWYEQSLFKDKLKLKIGKQDGNSDFQAMDTGFEFVNSGFNFIVNSGVPTFPDPAMGLTATIQPTQKTYLKYGFYDGQGTGNTTGFNTVFHKNDSYKHFWEVGVTPSIKGHQGKYLVGSWYNTKNTDEILGQSQLDNGAIPEVFPSSHGFYAEFEQNVFKENSSDDGQGLNVMAQYSYSPPNRTEMSGYYGTALCYKGIIPKRDNDKFGTGINFARFSNRLGHVKDESVLEIFYKIQLTPWLYLQPDFQYINKPYYAEKSTIVFGIRTNLVF